MADTQTHKRPLNPDFERELDRLCEQRDIDGLREFLLRPMDIVTVGEDGKQKRVPKIISQCRNNDVSGLYFTLAHPDMTSECLFSQKDNSTTSYIVYDSPLAECISTGSVECLREILNSPFITKDDLGTSALSCYVLHTYTTLTDRMVECVKMILYHELCDTTVINSHIRELNSHIRRDTTLLSKMLSCDNYTITELILERYNDKEMEELFTESVICTLLSIRWNETCELLKQRLYRMRAFDRIFSPELWNRIEHVVPPNLIRYRQSSSYAERLVHDTRLFPKTWDEACECDGRLNMLLSSILNHGDGIMGTDDRVVVEFMIENIKPIMSICTPRCSSSMFEYLIDIYSPERIIDLRFETPSKYNLFQLYCHQVGLIDNVLMQAQYLTIEKMTALVHIGINPNAPFPDGRSIEKILERSSKYMLSEVKQICESSAGKFTKKAL